MRGISHQFLSLSNNKLMDMSFNSLEISERKFPAEAQISNSSASVWIVYDQKPAMYNEL